MRKVIIYFFYATLAVAAVISFALLFPAYNDMKKMRGRISQLENELDKKKSECMDLRQLLVELEKNPKAIEKIAREKYNLHKKDDKIYKYKPEDLERDKKE